MRKFCFVCGKTTDKLVEGACEDCIGKRAFVELPKKIEITQCSKCKKVLARNKWIDFSIEKTVESLGKVRGKVAKVEAKEGLKKITATFFLTPHSSDDVIKETHEAVFHINKVICSSCSRKHSGYYEAVLQLRGFDENDLERMGDIFGMLERKTFYRITEVDGGFDVKVGNKLAVGAAAADVRKKFHSDIKKSSKIVTKIDGRDVHRKFILIRKIPKKG
ncbi:MAG: NMD3-related protein [Candidatus Aenigmatarchaeota archaeon]